MAEADLSLRLLTEAQKIFPPEAMPPAGPPTRVYDLMWRGLLLEQLFREADLDGESSITSTALHVTPVLNRDWVVYEIVVRRRSPETIADSVET